METINAGDLPEHNGTTAFYREASFTVRHPFIAHSIGSSDPDSRSTNISSDAARFSINGGLTENSSHEGSERNAMRHVTWAATITSEYGKDIAKQVGDAHEENPGADLTQRNFTGSNAMDQADQTVDLLNNIVGRQIGSDNAGASVKDIAVAALNEYHTNGLYTATVNKDGSVTIGKSKLSDKEYKADLKKINGLDANGFKPKPPEKKKDGTN
jgi:hypothetical protein